MSRSDAAGNGFSKKETPGRWARSRQLGEDGVRTVFQSITSRDLVESVVMLLVFAVVVVTFLVDTAYARVDPRLRR